MCDACEVYPGFDLAGLWVDYGDFFLGPDVCVDGAVYVFEFVELGYGSVVVVDFDAVGFLVCFRI